MGLSSSQARLLNLTARMHDIEYKAQNLEAQKLQMANESRHVYQEYEDALNKQKVQFKQIGADGSANYVDANITTLLKNGYNIIMLNGGKWYDYTGATETNAADNWTAFKTTATTQTLTVTSSVKAGEVFDVGGKKYKAASDIGGSTTAQSVQVYEKDETATGGTELAKIDFNNVETLRNLVEAGFIVFQKPNYSGGGFTEVNIATDTSLQEVSDETELKKAEAKYEADMRKINLKDKKFDTDLAAMEQERNAIKTEMDTLKTVAKDNVDRTFKLFS